MSALTKKQAAFWDAQTGPQTCRECGKVGPKYYVQPQFDGKGALCTDCITAHNERITQERKAALAARPRCEVPGCNRAQTFKIGSYDPAWVCKAHADRAIAYHRKHNSSPIWMPSPQDFSKETLLDWATRKD